MVNNDFIEIMDLLLTRYDKQIWRMPLSFGIKLIFKALEKRQEQKHWEMWLIKYQWMDDSNYVAFEDFYKPQKLISKKMPKKRSREELLQMEKDVQLKINNGNFTEVKFR